MKTYQIDDGSALVISVNGGPWETIAFQAADFKDATAATADELAAVLNRSGSLAATADAEGNCIIETAEKGGHATLEIDTAQSTAAGRLGIAGHKLAGGSGLVPARLISLKSEPFALPVGATMSLTRDNQKAKISFLKGFTIGKATAQEVIKIINARHAGIASVSRNGNIVLQSPTAGAGSQLLVDSAAAGADAAAILGFIGSNGASIPYLSEPARLACAGSPPEFRLVNLSANPLELLLPRGSTLIPARATVAIASADIAHAPLQRLIDRGLVRLERGSAKQ